MITITHSQLTTPLTFEQCEQNLLDFLSSQGFAATSWQSGDPITDIIKAIAARDQHMSEMVAFYTANRFNATATDPEMMANISRSDFDNEPNAAVAAQWDVRFSLVASELAIAVGIGELVVATEDGSVTFRNIEAGTIPSGSYVDLLCEAEVAGTGGNVAIGEITTLVTTLAGVTVSNPTAQVQLGVSPESVDALRVRNAQKWATLSVENTNDAVEFIIKTAVPAITSVAFDDTNPRGAGTVDIYVASELSAPSPSHVASALAAARARYFNADPRINVVAATTIDCPVAGTILYNPTIGAIDTLVAVDAALKDLLRALPIGGRSYQSGDSHVLLRDDVIDALKEARGVVAVSLTGSGNYTVGEFVKMVVPSAWTLTLTPTVVT